MSANCGRVPDSTFGSMFSQAERQPGEVIEALDETWERVAMCGRDVVRVEDLDVVADGVVECSGEVGRVGDLDSPLA